MASSRWPQALKCKILAPDADHACTSGKGRVLDYLMYSVPARPFIKSVDVVRQVPWGPHLGLRIQLAARPGEVQVRIPRLPRRFEIPT
eukprot:7810501-Pyramimonas_sp.AAC.1